MRRVAIIAATSLGGKTTFRRALAARLGVPFHEFDAIHWRSASREASPAELRRQVEAIVARDSWVIDGSYRGKLGDLVLEAADTVVWLDLPRRIWLARLVRRTLRRTILREELWNGNREWLRGALVGPGSLFGCALRTAPRRRQRWPRALARSGSRACARGARWPRSSGRRRGRTDARCQTPISVKGKRCRVCTYRSTAREAGVMRLSHSRIGAPAPSWRHRIRERRGRAAISPVETLERIRHGPGLTRIGV